METPLQEGGELTLFIALVICAVIALVLIIILLFFVSRRRIVSEKLQKQALALKHKSELVNYNIEIQEKERQRIAQDLHDDVGQKLNLISMNLHRLKKMENGMVSDETNEILLLTDGVIDRVRKISHQLMPPVLEKFGLISGIEEMAFSFNKTKAVKVDFKTNIERGADDFPELERLNLYRICQELLSNAIKHGKANFIRIRLLDNDESIQLFFSDDGIGFQEDALQHKKGMGVMNIENRVEMLRGTMNIVSNANQGVEFEITLPKKK